MSVNLNKILQMRSANDHWTSEAYSTSASFVPKLATTVTRWLDAQSTDKILDLGCGDGVLTAHIAETASEVLGIDASASMIETARGKYHSQENESGNKCSFKVVDCRHLDHESEIVDGGFDKVFSNAALHWILRDEITRMSTIKGTYKALKRDGVFVFEMGGAGNVAEVHAALIAAVVHQGATVEQARQASPWFFPSEKLMERILEEAGFKVDWLEMEYRPTKLTVEEGGGLEGWVRLMGADFLEVLENEERRERAVRQVCETLETVIKREEDGSLWLGYVRLRGVASKE
ncbi:MAG: hypothetical protein M1830_006797 [Pleopsidium flavum]|nr:MAG: hypothetical protein M1830_006797 [Pleopsidium flavum]